MASDRTTLDRVAALEAALHMVLARLNVAESKLYGTPSYTPRPYYEPCRSPTPIDPHYGLPTFTC